MEDVLSVYYQNVRGLKTKTYEFRSKVLTCFFDVILLCETWLRADVFSTELFDDRYVVYRKDRDNSALNKGDGGGCLIAVRKDLVSKRIHGFEVGTDIWVSVEHVNGGKTYFNVKYIELRTSQGAYKAQFDKVVENLMSVELDDTVVLCGDYNLGDTVSWEYDSVDGSYGMSDLRSRTPRDLMDMMSLCNLNQLNLIRNVNLRTIDLFITNLQPSSTRIVRSNDPLVREDGHHPALLVSMRLLKTKLMPDNRLSKVNFHKANYAKINDDLLRVDWLSLLGGLGIEDAVEKFYAAIQPCIEGMPKVYVPSRDYPVYYSFELISLIRKKDAVRVRMKDASCPVLKSELRAEFSVLRKSVKAKIKECFDEYVKDCEEKMKSNTKCFFHFTKALMKTNSLPGGMKYASEEAFDRPSICNLFAKYFSSVHEPHFEEVMDPFAHQESDFSTVPEMFFTADEVEAVIKGFDKNKVSSPDGIPMLFFMQLSASLKLPLSILFNKSIEEMRFPSGWKMSFVSPIYKDGDKGDVINYRPVSILCAVSKIFERLVFNKLFDMVKGDIHHSQHGFYRKRSAQTNLMEYVSSVADAIVDGGQVDTVYTDFAKAFDKVDHAILLSKLSSFGLSTSMINWFSSYLRDRTQVVVIGGFKSDGFIPTSGVPQGSILGPLLFIMFINDLLSSLSACSGFADDLKLFRSISSSYDCQLLQDDLGTVVNWCRRNNMILNTKKCAVMSISHSRDKTMFQYTIDGEVLERVSNKKDLGVIIDDKLSFNEHVDQIVRKSYKMLGFVFRCGRYFASQSSLRLLYATLVRSRLEYCSSVWNPYYSEAMQQVERVQKKFTRLLYFKFKIAQPRPAYPERLKYLKLQSLETRRLNGDEIMLHKLIHGRVDSTLSQRLRYNHPVRATRRVDVFYLPRIITNYQGNAPIYRLQRNHDTLFRELDIIGNASTSFDNLVKDYFDW